MWSLGTKESIFLVSSSTSSRKLYSIRLKVTIPFKKAARPQWPGCFLFRSQTRPSRPQIYPPRSQTGVWERPCLPFVGHSVCKNLPGLGREQKNAPIACCLKKQSLLARIVNGYQVEIAGQGGEASNQLSDSHLQVAQAIPRLLQIGLHPADRVFSLDWGEGVWTGGRTLQNNRPLIANIGQGV